MNRPLLHLVLGFGIPAIMIMFLVEVLMAAKQRRRPEIESVVLAGVLGMGYFVGMLYAVGAI